MPQYPKSDSGRQWMRWPLSGLISILLKALRRIDRETIPKVIAALDDSDPAMRAAVADMLWRFTSIEAAERNQIASALGAVLRGDSEREVRATAVRTLKEMRFYEPALVVALNDNDAAIREAAAYALERTGGVLHPEAIFAIVEALGDSSESVRDMAYYALDHDDAASSVSTLMSVLKSDNANERARDAEILGRLAAECWETKGT